jgi:hypothetical protein
MTTNEVKKVIDGNVDVASKIIKIEDFDCSVEQGGHALNLVMKKEMVGDMKADMNGFVTCSLMIVDGVVVMFSKMAKKCIK